MQEPNAALVSGTRGRMMEPVDDDEYIRMLCRAILTRLSGPRVKAAIRAAARVLREDLARGTANAYHWHDLLRALPDEDASVRSAVRAVVLAINQSQ